MACLANAPDLLAAIRSTSFSCHPRIPPQRTSDWTDARARLIKASKQAGDFRGYRIMTKRIEGDYDYIIAGAGTAGCIMANRLSADPRRRVLLLEGGGRDNWIWFHIPVGYLFAIGNPRSDWMFKTEPQPGLNGRALHYPRGKVIGGSSAINAMICMRGQAADYNHWRQLGLTGWGWDDVLPVFKGFEDHFLGASDYHGTGGGWRVEAPRLSWKVLDAVADAAEQMGIRKIPDFNTGDNEGISYFHVNQKRGRRWSAARGFLKPVLDRPNLRLETNVLVDRLIIENGRAVGIRFRQGSEEIEARTQGEIILCAGSIGSPSILQRSGIGPAEWLQALGIDVVLPREGVGRNLQDHLQQRAIYKMSGVRTLNETYYNLLRRGWMGVDYALRRRGPLTMAPSQLGIFTRSDPSRDRANIQFHVQPLSLDKFGDPLHHFPAITISACNLQPTARGTIRLRARDAAEPPAISPDYLSTDEDRRVAADAIRVTRKLMKQAVLAPYRPEEYLPGPTVGDDDAALAKAAGDIGTTIFHPVGTAKMGLASDPGAVVDERLRLHGLKGLRVADASVMPTITSGNTNTPTAMISAKAAELIIADAK
jgi:choline dehydrogenase-like flavoprotein